MNTYSGCSEQDITKRHLERILFRSADALCDETRNAENLSCVYPTIGPIHPSSARERHAQHIIFSGLRNAGYYTHVETMYFNAGEAARRIDIGVWLPDVKRWLFLEVKPCPPLFGYNNTLSDAAKLIQDEESSPDTRNRLRGVVAYGFRTEKMVRDGFEEKYEKLSKELTNSHRFQEIGVQRRDVTDDKLEYVQVGLWARGI